MKKSNILSTIAICISLISISISCCNLAGYSIFTNADNSNNVISDEEVSHTLVDTDEIEESSSYEVIGPSNIENSTIKAIYKSDEKSNYFTYGEEYCVKEVITIESADGKKEYLYEIPLDIKFKDDENVKILNVYGDYEDFLAYPSE